jgi:single-strand DNA-binding protein
VTVRKAGLIKIVEAYLKKGDRVYVEGKIRYRSYEKDGSTRYITEVVADDLTLLGGQRDGGSNDRSAESTSQSQSASGDDSGSDDLPF